MFWTLGWMLAQGGGGEARIAPWRMVEMHSVSSTAVPEGPRVVVDTRGVWVDGVPVVEGPFTPTSDLSGLDGVQGAVVQASGALPVGLLQPVMERLDGADLLVEGAQGPSVLRWPLMDGGRSQGLRLVLVDGRVLVYSRSGVAFEYLCVESCLSRANALALGTYLEASWPKETRLQLLVEPGHAVGMLARWLDVLSGVLGAERLSIRHRTEAVSQQSLAPKRLADAQAALAALSTCPESELLLQLDAQGRLTRLSPGSKRCADAKLKETQLNRLAAENAPLVFRYRWPVPQSVEQVLFNGELRPATALEDPSPLLPAAVYPAEAPTDLHSLGVGLGDQVGLDKPYGYLDVGGRWFSMMWLDEEASAAEEAGPTLEPGDLIVHVDRLGFRLYTPGEEAELLYCQGPCGAPSAFPLDAFREALSRRPFSRVVWSFDNAADLPVDLWLQAHSAALHAGFWEHHVLEVVPTEGGLGSLAKASIQAVVMQAMPEIRLCYQRALTQDATLQGALKLRWTIGPDGDVVSSEVVSSEIDSGAMQACTLKVVDGMQFPAPNGEAKVTYPFVFSPG